MAGWNSPSAGELIRDVRRRRGLTQHQLARRAGTTQPAISRLERGDISPSVETLDRLLLVMGERLTLLAQRPERLERDAEEVWRGQALAMEERLERAFAWNAFASQVSGAARGGEDARP